MYLQMSNPIEQFLNQIQENNRWALYSQSKCGTGLIYSFKNQETSCLDKPATIYSFKNQDEAAAFTSIKPASDIYSKPAMR